MTYTTFPQKGIKPGFITQLAIGALLKLFQYTGGMVLPYKHRIFLVGPPVFEPGPLGAFNPQRKTKGEMGGGEDTNMGDLLGAHFYIKQQQLGGVAPPPKGVFYTTRVSSGAL